MADLWLIAEYILVHGAVYGRAISEAIKSVGAEACGALVS